MGYNIKMLLSKKGKKLNRFVWITISVMAVIGMVGYLIVPLFSL